MRKIIILSMFVVLFVSFASAEIIINSQLEEVYNLGDIINVPVKISAEANINNYFFTHLICNGNMIEISKNPLVLSVGEEHKGIYPVPFTKIFIGESRGECKIKFSVEGEDPELTNDFKISDLITLQITSEKTEFNPEETILIKGEAIKENGDNANGFIRLEIMLDTGSINQLETINNGFFTINISLPEDMKAGQYKVKLDAYERNSMGETTNQGFADYSILIKQVPTNLEVVFENSEVEPGTNLKVKAILHDQTGEKIESSTIITIKDEDNTILEQTEKLTDDFLEFPIVYNEPPAEWVVVAVSNKLTGEAIFKIKEKEAVKVELINKTITLTNVGNVLYNKSVLIRIENESLNIDVFLGIDENQKYVLTAPEGEYRIEILTDEGNLITGSATLTGKTVNVQKASGKAMTLVRYSAVWIFMIAVLGFVAFIIFKKGYKRSFFGYIYSKKKEKSKAIPLRKKSIINTKSKAELSLSIKGDKQNASVVCFKIKNIKEIESTKSNAGETLQKIVDFAEEKKAVVYENQENLFFILAPIKTRTFKNEKAAIEISQKMTGVLIEYNKLAKQKIEFGISLNYGTIIAKQEKDVMKFMSMGTLITTAKKIASFSEKEILLSEKINDRLRAQVKTEKHIREKTSFFTIKEMKNTEEHTKFIRSFISRLEKDKK